MQGLLEHPLLQSESCIICVDNVSWHHHELVKDMMDAAQVRHRMVRIPSYSPHLNPIEYASSVWKSPIKRLDQTTTSILIMKQVEDAAALITDTLISRCTDHVSRYYLHCMRGLPLEVRPEAAGCAARWGGGEGGGEEGEGGGGGGVP